MNVYLFFIKSIFTFCTFNFLNTKFEIPQEYYEPESFRPMLESENQANYSFLKESSIEQKIWSNHFKYIAPDLLRVIAHAKFFIQNHPCISSEAKEKIERLEIYLLPCYSASSIDVCGFSGKPDSIALQIHDTGFGGPGFVYSHRHQKCFIFGLLKNFGHIVYGDLDFLFQARTEQERLEAFEKCQNFYFQNKRAIYLPWRF